MWEWWLYALAITTIALWAVVAFGKSRVIRHLVFWVGTLGVCPALCFVFFMALGEAVLGDIKKPAGPGVLNIFLAALATGTIVWFFGYGIAAVISWWRASRRRARE